MTPQELATIIRDVLLAAIAAGEVDLDPAAVPDPVKVERPRNRDHGDWATNIAMQLARPAGTNPRALAELLAARIGEAAGISEVEVAGPGFLNIRLSAASAGELARTIVEAGANYGRGDALVGRHVNLEFVSANPTGPLHLGGARWAAVGDSLARVLENAGAEVVKEYYFNDHGSQIDLFALSLLARARGEEPPENGYGGQYISEIADAVVAQALEQGKPNPLTLDEKAAQEYFRKHGVELMFGEIKSRLHSFGVDFDVYFHEDNLHKSGAVARAIEVLRKNGAIVEQDDAIWLATTKYGDDKDRVIIKSDGNAAYFSGDIAYYLDKKERGADLQIIILGADHHGYVGRMMAMCAAYGDTPWENLEILIGQMVNLLKAGSPLRMSKRAGTVVTMDDLVDAVGVDAARYSLARASIDTTLDIDLDLLSSNTNDNPIYYVQYAHARTCNVNRNASEHGVERTGGFDPIQLDHRADRALLGVLAQYPEVCAQAAKLREPHRVARYLESLAAAYHTWYGQCRVTPRGNDPVDAGHIARRWLNEAVGQVLRNGLIMMGVGAPERM